jgi:hypothetical protein
MAKKALPEKSEPANNKAPLIKIIIIAGTFGAIAALSIITRGPNDGWPSLGVIAARIVLLSACTVVYFWMLYHTRASRQNEKQKPQTGKK